MANQRHILSTNDHLVPIQIVTIDLNQKWMPNQTHGLNGAHSCQWPAVALHFRWIGGRHIQVIKLLRPYVVWDKLYGKVTFIQWANYGSSLGPICIGRSIVHDQQVRIPLPDHVKVALHPECTNQWTCWPRVCILISRHFLPLECIFSPKMWDNDVISLADAPFNLNFLHYLAPWRSIFPIRLGEKRAAICLKKVCRCWHETTRFHQHS